MVKFDDEGFVSDTEKVVVVFELFVSLKLSVVDCPGATGFGLWPS
jgi:hypothetical protein